MQVENRDVGLAGDDMLTAWTLEEKEKNERRCANKEPLDSAASRRCLIASIRVLCAAFYSIGEHLVD